MSTHKRFDEICCVVLAVTLLLTALFMNAEKFGVHKASTVMGYENKLFDTSTVHTIDIIMDDWDNFTANCASEEYYACSVVIDNEAYKNVAIRGKGNSSLTQVKSYGNDRYSFKIEFDRYDSTKTYHGLDKLCLNNIIQDNTYMKDYLTYRMMNETGVASPLCSYVYITVNGEDWGLYLAVEGVEDSFLQRNYGKNCGELYKPDSQSMGGGRGNGLKFNIDESSNDTDTDTSTDTQDTTSGSTSEPAFQIPDNIQGGATPPELPSGETTADFDTGNTQGGTFPGIGRQMPGGNMPGGEKGGVTVGSDDVLLKYIDDEFESYANIFNNAKSDVTDSDKKRLIEALKKLSSGEETEDTVDVEKVIRYFVVHNFVLNFDSYTGSMVHNYYLYEKDGQLQMIPWDYNLAFGGFGSVGDVTGLVNYPIDTPVSGGNVEDRPMLAWIFANEEYTELYHQYFAEFVSEYFDSGRFNEMIDSVSAMIAPYVEKDPTKFCTYEEFETGVSTLKEFCLLRAESVTGQLNGTIGSTSDTQASDTLVDAGDIKITDMGSMNNTMGGGKTEQPGGDMQEPQGGANTDEMPELPSSNDDATSSDSSADRMQAPPEFPNNANGDSIPPGTAHELPTENTSDSNPASAISDEETPTDFDAKNSNEQMPKPNENAASDKTEKMSNREQATTASAASWVWIGISAGVLLLGLAFALFFKRKRI